MDVKDQESCIEDVKFISNENLHIPGSPVSHVLEGGPITVSSVQFGNSKTKYIQNIPLQSNARCLPHVLIQLTIWMLILKLAQKLRDDLS
jgi:hypothetical protein